MNFLGTLNSCFSLSLPPEPLPCKKTTNGYLFVGRNFSPPQNLNFKLPNSIFSHSSLSRSLKIPLGSFFPGPLISSSFSFTQSLSFSEILSKGIVKRRPSVERLMVTTLSLAEINSAFNIFPSDDSHSRTSLAIRLVKLLNSQMQIKLNDFIF